MEMLQPPSKVVIINTGNVLNLLEIKKKAGQNVTEELSECIKITLSEWKTYSNNDLPESILRQGNSTDSHKSAIAETSNSSQTTDEGSVSTSITRPMGNVQLNLDEEAKKNLKIGVKVFINVDGVSAIIECLENVFSALHTECIDNLILAYNPTNTSNMSKEQSTEIDTSIDKHSITGKLVPNFPDDNEGDSEADIIKCDSLLPGIKTIWQVLEDYVKRGRISELGVADTGVRCLRILHQWSRVRPSIAQINLASCCVVPPALHDFCRKNDVQLLTHADPPDLLKEAANKSLDKCTSLDWCARYQVHIKCRGVLTLKGYICKATLC